jgi:nucleoside-diphosphate-sugar epimerase
MRILLTGASGGAGRFVLKELVRGGHQVVCVDRRPLDRSLVNENVTVCYSDIADPLAMMTDSEGCDAICHLAAYPTPHHITTSELLRVNVIGTQNVLDAAMAHGIQKVVMASSIGALGFSFPPEPIVADYLPIDINHPRRPADAYGLSKLMNEESAAAATRQSGITTIVLRPPMILDFWTVRTRPWMANMPKHRVEHRSGDYWGYIDQRDFAIANRLALESSLTGHHVMFTVTDDVIADATPRELIERHYPELMPYADRVGNSFYDTSLARELIGFEAKYKWRAIWDGLEEPAD